MSSRRKRENIVENELIVNDKIELYVTQSTADVLNGQSDICNWVYNKLLETAINDYAKGNELKLTSNFNLRDYMVRVLKEEYPFLKTVYSSVLKNSALRLKNTFDGLFKEKKGFPKFRKQKNKWFSLEYEESFVGYKIKDNVLTISLGTDKDDNRLKAHMVLSRKLREYTKMKTLRICYEHGRYYAVFTVVVGKKDKVKDVTEARKRWCSIDPNHKNNFVMLDYKGETFELSNNTFVQHIDKQIDALNDELKEARKYKDDVKEAEYKKEKNGEKVEELLKAVDDLKYLDGYSSSAELVNLTILLETATKKSDIKKYFKGLKNSDLDKSFVSKIKKLYGLYMKRREQIKAFCYRVAHWLYKRYDYVCYGDYVPSGKVAPYRNMFVKMVQQDCVGQLRRTVSMCSVKFGKYFTKVDESYSTKNCCVCGDAEHKEPNIRIFTCKQCGTEIVRDVNSCVNHAYRDNLLPRTGHETIDLSIVTCKVKYHLNGDMQLIKQRP